MRIFGPPYGRLRQILTAASLSRVLVYWALAYSLVGLAFGGIYLALADSGDVVTCLKGSEDVHTRVLTLLHFSFVTQATLGYGDCSPLGYARLISAMQAFVGLTLNALVLGAVASVFVNNRAEVLFPKFLAYDKGADSFWFRLVSTDVDPIVDASVAVFVQRVAHSRYSIELARVMVDFDHQYTFPGLVNCAIKTVSNNGSHIQEIKSTIDLEPIILSPLNLRSHEEIRIEISGKYPGTGNQAFASRKYQLKDIRCGLHASLSDEDLRGASLKKLHFLLDREPSQTPDHICLRCPFLDAGCPLDLAERIRAARTASELEA